MSVGLPYHFVFSVPRANFLIAYPGDLSADPLALPPLLFQRTSLHEFESVRLPRQSTD
jgi:hypothetical protein